MDPQANDERALYASVRNLIRNLAESVRDGFAHGTPVKVTTDGTISGDLFAAIGAALEYAKHGRTGILAGATLSSLLNRYPAPVECRQPPCGDAGAGDVREVRDDSGAGRGQTERGGVHRSADVYADTVIGARSTGAEIGEMLGHATQREQQLVSIIVSRDKEAYALLRELNRLARYIAFGVAKP